MTAWLDSTFDVIAVAVFGLAAVALGGWAVFHAVRQTFWWPKAPARILRYWITRSGDEPEGQRFFHPVLRFETEDGQSVTTISSWGSWRRPWPMGNIVSVRYDPKNPRRAEVTCVANVWGNSAHRRGIAGDLGPDHGFEGLPSESVTAERP